MAGDYFNEYLVPDFNNLDRELGGHQWFQKEEERDAQKALSEQNDQGKDKVEDSTDSPTPPTADPFRPTYDRKNMSESKKDRLERIKKEYEWKPFISVGSWQYWDGLRKRRDKRREDEKQIVDESFKEGLAANSPGLTQLIEQNEPTIMPKKLSGIKGFCKRG